MMMTPKTREYRAFDFEAKEDNGDLIVEGTPVVFESPTVIYEIDGLKFYEVVDRHAFDKTHMSDVVFVENHGGTPGARTKNGSLEIKVDQLDVKSRANLRTSSKGPAMYSDIKNGIYDKMSFSFTVSKDSYDKNTRTRRILEIDRLYDVSVVTFPAYEQTSINARSFYEVEAEKEMKEHAEAIQRELKLEALKKMLKGD